MISTRILGIAISSIMLAAPAAFADDLSNYRQFQFGMKLPEVVKLLGTNPPETRVIHERPAFIQELSWEPIRYPGSLPEGDPVKGILFSFCNGELFRMVVTYDRYKTEGLTAADMIEGISAKYGTSTRPATEIVFPSIYNETVKVIARWEDSQYSFNLVRSSYQPVFGMILYSKSLDALVRTGVTEALRLDAQEAPSKEAERQRKQEEENRVKEETARLANKTSFRP
jgi:hypothetical protein